MVLRYRNTIDDLAAFIRSSTARSPTYRRTVRWSGAAVAFFALAAFGGKGLLEGRWGVLPGTILFMALFLLLYRLFAARSLTRTARRLAAEGPNDGVLCEHALEITATGLVERTPVSESLAAWAAILRVVETPEHVFVYTQPHAAYVIPKGGVLDGDLPAFLAALREKVPSREPATT